MNVRSMILAAAVFLGASTHVWAAINDWTAIGPSGGTVNKIVFNKAMPSSTAVTAVPSAPSKGGGGSLSIDYLLMLALVLIIQERAHWARKRKAW
jgi:hypothetical protein